MSTSGEKNFSRHLRHSEHLIRKGNYEAAILYCNKALALRGKSKRCLLLRGRCQLFLGNKGTALEDAERVLALGGKDALAMLLKADALFDLGEYEHALIYYQRGRCHRPTINNFRRGIRKSEEAIINLVGDPNIVTLAIEGDESHVNKFKENDEFDESHDSLSRSYSASDSDLCGPPMANLIRNSRTVRELLGHLYHDRHYVNELLRDIKALHPQFNVMLREMKTFLGSWCEFWQRERPAYFRRHGRWLQCDKAKNICKSNFMHSYLAHILVLVDTAMSDWSYSVALKHAKRTFRMTQLYRGFLRDRAGMQADILYRIARAYDLSGVKTHAITSYKAVVGLTRNRNREFLKMQTMIHLGVVLNSQPDQPDIEETLKTWMTQLSAADTGVERCWLCHEIGRWHLKQDNLTEALEWGDRTLMQGQFSKEPHWQIYGLVLMAQARVDMFDLTTARENYESALSVARILDEKKVHAALTIAITRLIRLMHQSEESYGNTIGVAWLSLNRDQIRRMAESSECNVYNNSELNKAIDEICSS